MTEDNNQQAVCVYCSKPIASDAVYCSYCGKEQKKETKLPSQWRLLILNLVCPGAGDWYLGAKLRALIIFLVVIGSLVAYCYDIVPVIQKAVNDAVLHGRMVSMNKLNDQISNNGWMYLFTISYIFSIIDSFFLLKNKKKELEESKTTSHE
ncbi:MAG: hypothetical protein II567_01670 [Candidatus Riflebacteria bacterium]|jgi:predicted nucleic acid-binding Zn ribbon protein|nr:hypothetical protein [Candidatus Riflebacteria bacterium]